MKVAIDSGPLIGKDAVRGIGAYTRELINALKNLRTKKLRPKDDQPLAGKNIKIEAVDFRGSDLSKYDLLHFPNFKPYFLTLPLKKKTKWVVTIHDLIPLIYPAYYPPGLRGQIKFKIQKYLLAKVDGIICPSETSKKDIVRFLDIPEEKIKVIYEAPSEIYKRVIDRQTLNVVKCRYNLPSHFVLYVGDVNYNKNLIGLADACKIAKIPLVIVGKQAASTNIDFRHVENKPFFDFLEKYGDDPDIFRLGYINDEDLVAIYNLASLYCQPSFYEGFGLPVLEAFVCGCPVVAAKTQALVEIADDAAIFANPKNPKELAEKINSLLNNAELRASLIRKGKERAGVFSWSKAASETLSLYKKILG